MGKTLTRTNVDHKANSGSALYKAGKAFGPDRILCRVRSIRGPEEVTYEQPIGQSRSLDETLPERSSTKQDPREVLVRGTIVVYRKDSRLGMPASYTIKAC